MKMGHESARLGAIVYQLIVQKVGLKATDTKTPYAFDTVERLHKIYKAFAGGLAKVAYVNPGQHYFAPTLTRRPIRLLHQRGNRGVARVASGKWYGAIRAKITAPILHF